MLKKVSVNVLMAISFSLLSGCASMFQGSQQNLTVATIDDKRPDRTRCNIKNEEGEWTAAPNAAVSIHRDGNTMEIKCDNGMQSGINHIDPQFNGAYLGLDLLFDACIVSCIIDGANNSFYQYPSFVTVLMKYNSHGKDGDPATGVLYKSLGTSGPSKKSISNRGSQRNTLSQNRQQDETTDWYVKGGATQTKRNSDTSSPSRSSGEAWRQPAPERLPAPEPRAY